MPAKNKNVNNSTTTSARPTSDATSSAQSAPDPQHSTFGANMATTDFKAELLAALREEMASIFKAELQVAMTQNLSQIKSELQNVKTELTASLAATKSDVGELRLTVTEMEGSLSICTDDVVALKNTVEKLSSRVSTLENKCDDLEGRSRRNNVRILGLTEQHATTAASVSSLLKEALGLDKEPLIDRAHRSLNPKPKPGERPRPVIARLHYYADCVDIL